MTPGELIAIAGVGVIAIALVFTWYRNGRGQSEKYGALTEQVKQVNSHLDEHGKKLDAIQTAVNEQKVNCATISTSLEERIEAAEREGRH